MCVCLPVSVYVCLSIFIYVCVCLSVCALCSMSVSVSMSVYVCLCLPTRVCGIRPVRLSAQCVSLAPALSTTNQPVGWLSVPRSVLTAFVPLLTSRPDSDLVRGHTTLVKTYMNRHVVAVHEIHAPMTMHDGLAACSLVMAAQVFCRWHNGRSMCVRCSRWKSQVICGQFQGASRGVIPRWCKRRFITSLCRCPGRAGLLVRIPRTPPYTVQELCESRGGRPGLSVLTSLLVSVDVKLY